ncbi:hypothetical protein JCM19235_4830 [Vibrio maritimus]|uniref:Uncharacterized protein n=1 Tax=Vibrio maritimus TaxID=990268 RepID=A0A090S3G4_9VIBR|nr:hypothetical protein JCM19235_4830 [Vibrio maritimus]
MFVSFYGRHGLLATLIQGLESTYFCFIGSKSHSNMAKRRV